jgi:hypothetical protein
MQSPKHFVLNERQDMDNVQNCESYINIPTSQTYGENLPLGLVAET